MPSITTTSGRSTRELIGQCVRLDSDGISKNAVFHFRLAFDGYAVDLAATKSGDNTTTGQLIGRSEGFHFGDDSNLKPAVLLGSDGRVICVAYRAHRKSLKKPSKYSRTSALIYTFNFSMGYKAPLCQTR